MINVSGYSSVLITLDLAAAYEGLRQTNKCIETTEVQDTWTRATGAKPLGKGAPKMGHRLFTKNLQGGIAYTVSIGDARKYLFICEPPEIIKTEDISLLRASKRLHCEDGPALKWGDFTEYFIHGVCVDEQIVMRPETQTIKQILQDERNEEVRRIRMERYGMLRLMEHSNTLDRRDNDIECTKEVLVQLLQMRFLICHCPSTARIYTLQVPFTVKSCEEAQAWLWGGSELLFERVYHKVILDKPKFIPQMGEEVVLPKHRYEEVVLPPMRLNIIGRS